MRIGDEDEPMLPAAAPARMANIITRPPLDANDPLSQYTHDILLHLLETQVPALG